MMPTAASSPPRNVAVRAMPLAHADAGDTVRIVRIRAEGREIQEMMVAGLNVGRLCPVLGRLHGGGVLVALNDRRLAVGATIAHHIWVRLVDD